ncbi:unnamed protein product [Ranitomeya imitator]|uniref:Alpha-macroglobulin-like TED domain-containing protein n=1 Tax=Ranitomeya imitator TaxID=111125 RepID=A0ABN9LCT0_9NEOB|nr:unnamed protein product [Ranitomeya imitator]CAJ0956148.1 unnamed protein product [Ranitomeya imitator]
MKSESSHNTGFLLKFNMSKGEESDTGTDWVQGSHVITTVQEPQKRECQHPWNGASVGGEYRLTAYVVKMFSLASSLVDVEKNLICDSVKWLILNKQNPDGEFREDAHVYHQEMVGGVTKGATELDCSLTSFVLVALLASSHSCNDQVGKVTSSTLFQNHTFCEIRVVFNKLSTQACSVSVIELSHSRGMMKVLEMTGWQVQYIATLQRK